MSEPTYEERDPPTAVDSLLAAATAAGRGKRRRLYITKRSGSRDEVGGEAEEEASNEVVKRRALDQLQNVAQSRRGCKRVSGQA